MRKLLPVVFTITISIAGFAQKIDSFYFNLYTDSLKKGTWNYINVDGKLSSGTFFPLTDKHLDFKSSVGNFERNNLWIDRNFNGDSVIISVFLKENPRQHKSITLFIKKREDEERLKTVDEILNEAQNRSKKSQKNKKHL
ncbi:MAG TPA: hypothetical protein VFN30_01155 [Chitinophagaceae bacterium]|nr:hypothetical protein [Chitinophagaceae bacterium]